jgi:hypothetical protein
MLGRGQAWNTAFANDEIMEAAGGKQEGPLARLGRRPGPESRCTAFPGAGLSKVQSVDQRMRLWSAVSAFTNCGRAVAHVRGSYVPEPVVSNRSKTCAYSITSSARASRVGATSRPSAFAVFRLMMNSNLVGCNTGRSAGLAPLRIRPM